MAKSMAKTENKKAGKKGRGLKTVLVILIIALIAVIGVIAWKQWEYGASADYYDGLRSAVNGGWLL